MQSHLGRRHRKQGKTLFPASQWRSTCPDRWNNQRFQIRDSNRNLVLRTHRSKRGCRSNRGRHQPPTLSLLPALTQTPLLRAVLWDLGDIHAIARPTIRPSVSLSHTNIRMPEYHKDLKRLLDQLEESRQLDCEV